MKNILLKAITLLLFTSLIISFVAYRTGYLDKEGFHYSSSPNGGTLNNAQDTTKQKDSVKQYEMMSSSKVMILTDKKKKRKKKNESDKSKVKADTAQYDKTLMWSSKSAYIVDTSDVKKILETDTAQKK